MRAKKKAFLSWILLLLVATLMSGVSCAQAPHPGEPSLTDETPSLVATSPAAPRPTPPLQATWEALDSGDTAEEFTTAMGMLNTLLLEQEGDTFAGLWLLPTTPIRAAVAFIGDGATTLRPYLTGNPYADRVEIRAADNSYRVLEQVKIDLFKRVTSLGIEAEAYVDVAANQVVINVRSRQATLAALEQAGVELPTYVNVVEVQQGGTPEP